MSEEIELSGGPEELFGCRYIPPFPAVAGVVIRPSASFDCAVDEGVGARVAPCLVHPGPAVQRFGHRGARPSDGPSGAAVDLDLR